MAKLPFHMDIAVKCEDWIQALPELSTLCETAISAAYSVLDAPDKGELSIALVDDAEIRQLNWGFRGKDKPTNVLSFPNDGPALLLGDIVLAFQTIAREAEVAKLPFRAHVAHLLIHGYLHLCGFDHDSEAAAAVMEALEIDALRILNIDNPYKIDEP